MRYVFLVIAGVVAGVVAIRFLMSQNENNSAMNGRSQPPRPLPPANQSTGALTSQPSLAQIREKAEVVVQRFQKDALAFYVYQEAIANNLSVAQIETLRQRYGSYSVKPSFIAYLANEQMLLSSSTQLPIVISQYLSERGVQTSETDWERSIEKYVWEKSQKDAAEIVRGAKEDSNQSLV